MSDGLVFVRRIRRTPYSNRVEQAGVRGYSVYNHMILPKSFGMSVEEAYWHLREHVQLWDVSVQRQVEITGPDAARLVQWMTCAVFSESVCRLMMISDGLWLLCQILECGWQKLQGCL